MKIKNLLNQPLGRKETGWRKKSLSLRKAVAVTLSLSLLLSMVPPIPQAAWAAPSSTGELAESFAPQSNKIYNLA
ncbi:MAG: hypothetical protein HFI72_07130, partial [Peptococcaceae bacterium]|nr:hypothetical protein [Peptococcaceae bacterium]